MEPGKHSNSNILSPENDLKPENPTEDTTGIGRSYECTFCKRGFTNSQALGGHMNIHRKDKAKAKMMKNNQLQVSSKNIDPNIKPKEDYPNLRYRYIPQADHQQQLQTRYYRPVNYQASLPLSNPSFETENNYLHVWRPENFEISDHVDANFGLRIGSVENGDEDRGNHVNEKVEVDLELRLGHDR